MHFMAVAADYDGTLARGGKVSGGTLAMLRRTAATGRRLILVTGRELPELLEIFPEIDLFDRVVAENGALLYDPRTKNTRALGMSPPAEFIEALRKRRIEPLSVGTSIIATTYPHEETVLDVIRRLGLEFQLIFNKGAVMILPPGINKAFGLAAALDELSLSPHNVVAVGDGENDHALLAAVEFGAAVGNAVTGLKKAADCVLEGSHGSGVEALLQDLIETDLSHSLAIDRHRIPVGTTDDGSELTLPCLGNTLLIAGSSGAGKSTFCKALAEQLLSRGYQLCIIDPEGDYAGFEKCIALGDASRPPAAAEVLQALDTPGLSITVNLVAMLQGDRPDFLLSLLPGIQEIRGSLGRPHVLLIDEAHHVLPASWQASDAVIPQALSSAIYVTVNPKTVALQVLKAANVVFTLGKAGRIMNEYFRCVEVPMLADEAVEATTGEALFWQRDGGQRPQRLRTIKGTVEHRRHVRKYAEGSMPAARSFYFRGENGALNLRAQNLTLFLQLAEGIDDSTWLFHLRRSDYSTWIRDSIGDPELADRIQQVELGDTDPQTSRDEVRKLIEEAYTAPASAL